MSACVPRRAPRWLATETAAQAAVRDRPHFRIGLCFYQRRCVHAASNQCKVFAFEVFAFCCNASTFGEVAILGLHPPRARRGCVATDGGASRYVVIFHVALTIVAQKVLALRCSLYAGSFSEGGVLPVSFTSLVICELLDAISTSFTTTVAAAAATVATSAVIAASTPPSSRNALHSAVGCSSQPASLPAASQPASSQPASLQPACLQPARAAMGPNPWDPTP